MAGGNACHYFMLHWMPATGLNFLYLVIWCRCPFAVPEISYSLFTRKILAAAPLTPPLAAVRLVGGLSPSVVVHPQRKEADTQFGYLLLWCRQPDSSKLWCCRRPAVGKQMSTGHLHLDGFKSLSLPGKTKETSIGCLFCFGGRGGT